MLEGNPEKAIEYARICAGLKNGPAPLTERETRMLPTLEFWAIDSQESLRQTWAEFRLEHLSPDQADALEQFFVDQGMAGAPHQSGGVLGLFRLVATDEFEAYFMVLHAFRGISS